MPEKREQNFGGDRPAELLDEAYLRGVDLTTVGSFESCHLQDADLTDASLRSADLTDAFLRDADLTDALLENADLTDANLRRADLTDAYLAGANLTDAYLLDADLIDVTLWGADLTDAVLQRADLTDGELLGANLTDTDLLKANLTDALLENADLTDANLRRADLTDAKLRYADLTGANLRYADLTDANFGDADLTGANLRYADLTDANLRGADLTDANLRGADLTDANLGDADLTDAYLGDADLTDAYLGDADLTDAYLGNADLTDAYLGDADLTDANLRYADLTNADFTNSDARWVVLSEVKSTNCDFTGSDLLGADFETAILRNAMFDGATLIGARLYDTKLDGVSINDQTTFSSRTVYEKQADPCERFYSADSDPTTPTEGPGPDRTRAFTFDLEAGGVPNSFALAVRTGHILQSRIQEAEQGFVRRSAAAGRRAVRRFVAHRTLAEPRETVRQLGKAISVYRSRQRLHRRNSQPADVESPYIREKSCRRKRAFIRGNSRKWLTYATSRWVMLYGESPARVVGTSLAMIGTFAALYAVFGGVHLAPEQATHALFDPGATLGIESETLEEASSYLYFSAITFSTLGYGGIQPATTATQLLASVQSLLGGILIALLVAVFARRVLR